MNVLMIVWISLLTLLALATAFFAYSTAQAVIAMNNVLTKRGCLPEGEPDEH